MAWTVTSGSQTATIGTEHTLATRTNKATYVLMVDVANLADGDELILRCKTKIRTGDTTRTLYTGHFAHAQEDDIIASIPVLSDFEFVATLEQVAGTGRAFPWKIVEIPE